MRAAYVCTDPGVPIFGRKGCSVHVQELVRALAREGVAVEIIAASIGGDRPPDLTASVHAPGELQEAARRGEIERLNLTVSRILAGIAPVDFVYERHALWSWTAMTEAASRGVPALLEINAPLIDEHARHRGHLDVAAARGATSRAVAAASALLAVSKEVAAFVAASHQAAEDRIHVVPNGVDPIRFTPGVPPSLPNSAGGFTVGFAGSMKPWHGLPMLAAAFAAFNRRASGARLLLVGDGPEAERTGTLLAEWGAADATVWTGAVDPSAMPGLVTSMDVAVAPALPAADFYFSPLKVYEYMAAGRPVVASRVGQLAEVIEHERTGLLFDPGDEKGCVDALWRLRRSEALRAALAIAARDQAVACHSWRSVARRVLSLVEGSQQSTVRQQQMRA